MKSIVISLLCSVLGLSLAVWGYVQQQTRNRIEEDGISAPAVVESSAFRIGRGLRSSILTVSFLTADGKKITKEFSVPKSLVEKHVAHDMIIRDRAEVRYLPSHPEECILVGTPNSATVLLYGGAGLGLAGLVASWLLLRRRG